MKTVVSFLTLFFGFLPFSGFAQEQPEFRFSGILSDHIVLQQDKPITIWGWAKPGVEVTVTLTRDAKSGAKAEAEAIAQGTRKEERVSSNAGHSVRVQYVETNPPPFETQSLKVTAGSDGRWSAKFKPAKASFQPVWMIARSGERTLVVNDVLIGEVWVCAGQSNMGWVNFNRKSRVARSSDCPGLRYVAWNDSWYKPLDDLRKPSRWQPCTPEAAERFSAVPYLYGMFLQRYLKVPVGIINVARGGTTGQAWCMREELDQLEHITVTETLRKYDAETAVWDQPTEVEKIMKAWQEEVDAKKSEHEKAIAKAKAEGKKEPRLRLPKAPGDPRNGWSPPAGLFNATIMPIKHLGVRGVLYYQGENNSFNGWTRYEQTFPSIPSSFRSAFGEPELPFGCISQPGWGTFGREPELETINGGYALIRDIQRRALKDDKNAAMIATYPAGNSYIHPGEKFPVAEYASLWALARVYEEPIVHRGNEFEKMTLKDGKAYLYFDSDPVVYERWKHIENNASWQVLPQPYQGKAPIQGFIIAGKDRRWYPAKARETKVDGTWTIEVSSDLVPEPVAVRYGWANWPTGNLVGRERLPIPTFRTDDWPLVEGVSYSDEARKAATDKIKALEEAARLQILDRKLRQLALDLPAVEAELHKGKVAAMVASKLDRIIATFAELENDKWLSNTLRSKHPELLEQAEELAVKVRELKSTLPSE
jgi:sialate O-acetylesterase